MRKIKIIILAFLVQSAALADEGMWIPMFLQKLNYQEMQNKGLELTADQIYSVNKSSIKDAIVRLGGGFCTGEIISPEGLILTNHHCAYDYIQQHSSVENDLLANGFWAKTKKDELPNEDLYVEFLVRMADVTDEVLKNVHPEMNNDQREHTVQDAINKITKREKGDTEYNVVVNSFFEGNEYYMFVYETYYDVRLVGAPPESIGKFGGDTDNWMWPRHTGDFSLFRVYTGPDGKPAPYSPDNIPLKPRHYLPVSLDGVKEGDFSMVYGFPGSTDRYLTSFGVKMALEESNPARVSIRDERLKIIKEDMEADKDIRLKYAAKYAEVSNYWKYFIGQSKGLENLNVYDKKKIQEEEFTAWVNQSKERQKEYGSALELIKEGYQEFEEFNIPQIYIYEAGFGPEFPLFGYRFSHLKNLLSEESPDKKSIKKLSAILRESVEEFYKDYNPSTDQKVFAALMQLYYENVDPKFYPSFFTAVEGHDQTMSPEFFEDFSSEQEGDFVALAEYIFSNSVLVNKEKLMNFLRKPDLEILENDPAFKTSESLVSTYRALMNAGISCENKISTGNRLYIKGLREMHPGKKYYPNANSTLRITYGNILGYETKEGNTYQYYTTLKGVIDKEDPSNPEFTVHPKLKELYEKKDYGAYGDNGDLVVGFLSNTDITGGNSGSPVINANGELIGTAFDGNWEAMSGDIAFEPEFQRTISVDIRYTLFIIDKFAGASHLIDEMTIVKGDKRKKGDDMKNGL